MAIQDPADAKPMMADTETGDSQAVRVSRVIDMAPDALYDAWLDPHLVGKFLFATATGQVNYVEVDPKVGGHFVIVDKRSEGEIEHMGTYLELKKPNLIVFEFNVPQYSTTSDKVTVEIQPSAQGSEITLTQHSVQPGNFERVNLGWSNILARMSAFLNRQPILPQQS